MVSAAVTLFPWKVIDPVAAVMLMSPPSAMKIAPPFPEELLEKVISPSEDRTNFLV